MIAVSDCLMIFVNDYLRIVASDYSMNDWNVADYCYHSNVVPYPFERRHLSKTDLVHHEYENLQNAHDQYGKH